MLSSQLRHYQADVDEIIVQTDEDFAQSRLSVTTLIWVTRLAVIHADIFAGRLGIIAPERLLRIRQNLAAWLTHG